MAVMKAMVLRAAGEPLHLVERPAPRPKSRQVLVAVRSCAVCRTDLHVVDGDLTKPKLPLVPGHEIVGEVIEVGREVDQQAVPRDLHLVGPAEAG